MSGSRIARVLTWSTAAVALTAVLAPAAAAQPSPPTEQQIFAELGVDRVPADYVVLIDTSGSMAANELYDQVRSTLLPFLAGTDPVDHVAVYTFDSVVTPRYVGAGGNPGAVLAQVPAAPSTSRTDIGGAVSSALDELSRAGAAQIGSVVLLTDGKNEPLDGSPYTNTAGPAWTALKDRAARLSDADRTIRGYSLPLRSDVDGAALLRQVIPETTVVDPAGVPDIAGFLDRTKRAIRADKARQALAGDIGRGAVVEWPANTVIDMQSGEADVEVTLRSQLTKAPVTVSNLGLDVAEAPPGVVTLAPGTPQSIELRPGERATLALQLRWVPGPGWPLYERTESLEAALTVRADVSSPWTAALAPTGVELDIVPAPLENTRAMRLEAVVGYWWVLPVLGALLAALFVVWRVRAYFRSNPGVRGHLQFARLFTSDVGSVPLRRGPTGFTFPSSNGGPPGRGTVRPIRTGDGATGLEIVYSPDGSAHRRSTATLQLSGGAITIGSVEFTLDSSATSPGRGQRPRQRAAVAAHDHR